MNRLDRTASSSQSSEIARSTDRSSETADADGPGEQPGLLSPDGVRIELLLQVPELQPPLRGWLEVYLLQAAELMGISQGSISVAVVDEPCMAKLQQRHLGIDGGTDVLAFDLRDDAQGPLDGDLILCAETASHQATQRGHPTRAELLLYAIHGLLHLLGYDDHTPNAAAQMHQRENEILVNLGVGPVYGKTD